MGKSDEQLEQQGKRQAKAATGPRKRRSQVSQGGVADWANATPQLLSDAVCAITRNGCAIRLGYTRDGGAYAIGIYEQGEMQTEYLSPHEDLDAYLRGLIEDYGRANET